jgi:hypothetical protein
MKKISRARSPEVRPIPESAPWILLSLASKTSGLSKKFIRAQKIPMRRFGNSDYVKPGPLNAFIRGEEVK